MVKDDNFDDLDFSDSFESSSGFSPQEMTDDVFKQRNDPSELIKNFKLHLLNAYETKEVVKNDDGEDKVIIKIKRRKNTSPLANSQGVEEIISYVRSVINSHGLQGNTISQEEFTRFMRYFDFKTTRTFLANRKRWGVSLDSINMLADMTVNLAHLVISRTIENKERESYGESFKENTSRELKPMSKPGLLQKVGGFLVGGR